MYDRVNFMSLCMICLPDNGEVNVLWCASFSSGAHGSIVVQALYFILEGHGFHTR
jgi:hypothetical protein